MSWPPVDRVTRALPVAVVALGAAGASRGTRRAWSREACSVPLPEAPAEKVIRTFVALGDQPLLTLIKVGSIAFHSPPTLARIGLVWMRRWSIPSGRAQVVEYAVRSAAASTAFPVRFALAAAPASSSGAAFSVDRGFLWLLPESFRPI